MTVFDATPCALGEGPLWHPERSGLFWFDIIGTTLHGPSGSSKMDTIPSAMGWIDRDTALLATETALSTVDLDTGTLTRVAELEADNPVTRSNDGRADPWGGFWIGTMGKSAEPDAGAIYRYYRGEVRQLFAPVTISNAICFSPDRRFGYFADTARKTVWRVSLGAADGWPDATPEVYLDLNADDQNPDGAVIDRDGNMWLALWGASMVSCFDPKGNRLFSVPLPATQVTCPAFGGADYTTLFVTSAAVDLDPPSTEDGKTFCVQTDVQGQREHQVIL